MAGSLGSLVVEISANVAKFTTDMESVRRVTETSAQSMSDAFKGVGESLKQIGEVLAVAEGFDILKEKVEGAIEAAAGLEILSQRTGATVEGLANLSATARLSNTDNDQLAQGLQKLSKSMIDAAGGGAKTTAAFNAIGISTRDLVNLKPDEAFRLVAQRLAEYQDGAEKVAAAQLLLGKSGANLLPLLHDLADGGEVQSRVTAEQAKQAEEFEKNMARLKVTFTENFNALVDHFLPALSQLSENMLAAQRAGASLTETLVKIPLKDLWAGITNTPLQERIDAATKSVADLENQLQHPGWQSLIFGKFATYKLTDQLKDARAELAGLIAQQNAARPPSEFVGPPAPPKGQIQIKLGTQADDKAIRDAALKDLDRFIASENSTLTQREQFLLRYYNQDQITLQDYYAKRATAIEENLASVQDAYAREIAAAQKYADSITAQDEKAKAARTAAFEKIAELQDKSAKAASAATLALIQNGLDEQQAALKQKEAIEALNIELLRLQGNLEAAATAQRALSIEQIPGRHLGPEGDAAARAQIDATATANLLAAKQKQISELEAHESVIEQTIALKQKTGEITDLQAMQQLGAARQAEIAQLEVLSAQYDEIARKAQTPEAIAAAEQLHLKLAQLRADADPLAAKFKDMFQTAFADQFEKVLNGTESIRKAFSSMVNSIFADLNKMVSQNIAQMLFGGGGAQGGGSGGLFSSLFSGGAGLLSSLFGGSGLSSGQAGPPANLAGNAGFLSSVASLLPALEGGGDVVGGGAYVVGERGPELFTPRSGGSVTPAGAWGGSTTVHVHMPAGIQPTRESMNLAGAAAARQLAVVHARNN